MALMECPDCLYQMDRSFVPSDPKARPGPGDYSFCFNCGAALVFDERLQLRRITEEELQEAEKDPEFVRVRDHLRQFLKEHPREGRGGEVDGRRR